MHLVYNARVRATKVSAISFVLGQIFNTMTHSTSLLKNHAHNSSKGPFDAWASETSNPSDVTNLCNGQLTLQETTKKGMSSSSSPSSSSSSSSPFFTTDNLPYTKPHRRGCPRRLAAFPRNWDSGKIWRRFFRIDRPEVGRRRSRNPRASPGIEASSRGRP